MIIMGKIISSSLKRFGEAGKFWKVWGETIENTFEMSMVFAEIIDAGLI